MIIRIYEYRKKQKNDPFKPRNKETPAPIQNHGRATSIISKFQLKTTSWTRSRRFTQTLLAKELCESPKGHHFATRSNDHMCHMSGALHTYIHTSIHACIHYTTLHHTTLHYFTLHYITLQNITCIHTYIRYTTYITYITYIIYITLHYITLHTYIRTYVHTYLHYITLH